MRGCCSRPPHSVPHARHRSRQTLRAAADGAGMAQYRVETVASIDAVSPSEWDACAAGCSGGSNPFVCHGFLKALEDSRSVDVRTGWVPRHLVARDAASGAVLGVAPAYLKGHSYGEYVFDNGWAQAYQRAGGRYYPKLQVAVPFTPVTGPRLLVRSDAPASVSTALARGIEFATEALDASSAHVTFPSRREAEMLQQEGWLLRTGMQYHWPNMGYTNFADFEAALLQKRRKAVRQERKRAREGLVIRRLRGSEITARHWDAFNEFYIDTVDRKWGEAYLNRVFFDLLGENLGDAVMLVVAEVEEPGGGGEIVAGALNLVGSRAVFGRNWGCRGDWPCLHFELCYYAAIEEAIERGLERVEAGAQGEHKMQRGYLPTLTYSAHHIRAPQFRTAVSDFLDRERVELERVALELSKEASPYKDGGLIENGVRTVS